MLVLTINQGMVQVDLVLIIIVIQHWLLSDCSELEPGKALAWLIVPNHLIIRKPL